MGRGNKNRSSVSGSVQKIDYGLGPSASTFIFMERENLTTESLHSVLERGDKNVNVIFGSTEMGKSTLVKQYVKIYRQNYRHVILLQAQDVASMTKEFHKLTDTIDQLTSRKCSNSLKRKSSKRNSNDWSTNSHDTKCKMGKNCLIHDPPGQVKEQKQKGPTTKILVKNLYSRIANMANKGSGGGGGDETLFLPNLVIFDDAFRLGSRRTGGDSGNSGKEMEGVDDGIFEFLPNFNLHKKFVRILVTTRNESEWDEKFCKILTLEPFSEEETINLFFDTLKFELEQNHTNRLLALKVYKWTLGNPMDLQCELRYKSLVLRYQTRILKELKEPEKIGRALWNINLFQLRQLKQLCRLRVREHKNRALFEMFLSSKSTQIQDLIHCVSQQFCGKLKDLFILIAKRVSQDIPWDLHDAASARNAQHLSTLHLKDHLDDEKFWIKNGQTPLHIAVVGEDSKKALKFVVELLHRVSTCVDLKTKVPRAYTAWDVIQNIREERRDLSKRQVEEEILKRLVGTIVTTYYNKRIYKVTSIDFGMTPLSTFLCRNSAQETSYVDYYRDHYKVKIEDRQQPLLLGKLTKGFCHSLPSYGQCHLIPELCNIGQLQKNGNSSTWLSRQWPTTQDFLDHQDNNGMTALHLAAQHESVEIVKFLYDQQANIVIENKAGVTPLELMYEKAPAAVTYILDKALPLCDDHSTKGNLEFDVDFLSVLGYVEDEFEISTIKFFPPTKTPNVSIAEKFEEKSNNSNCCLPSFCQSSRMSPEDRVQSDLEKGQGVLESMLSIAESRPKKIQRQFSLISKPTEWRFRNSGNYDRDRVPREMSLLANMVLCNFENSSKTILSHVIVKAFLELKWKKLRWPIRIWTLFYIILHFWFTWFIISVFIVSYPHGGKSTLKAALGNQSEIEENNANDNHRDKNVAILEVWQYLVGVWDAIDKPHMTIESWSPNHRFQAIAFIGFGFILTIIEVYEFVLIARLAMIHQNIKVGHDTFTDFEDNVFNQNTRTTSPWEWLTKFGSCISVYLFNLENIFQLLFIFLMLFVSTVIFQNSIDNFYYEAAAVSVVVAWTLILLQFANFYELGKYVNILKTVLRSFFIVMGVYLVLVLSFCISFSILFNEKQLFLTLPHSFFRALSMMAGELNYESIFEAEDDDNQETKAGFDDDLAFPFAKQILHACFTVVVTVILINLLIGLTVSDIEKIRGKSDVIFRSIQVERLYIMENFMIHFVSWLVNMEFMYVVPLHSDDMVIRQPVKNLPPRLQREIRFLLSQNEDRSSVAPPSNH